MPVKRVTEIAQDAVRARLRPRDTAVDATAGNGGDTIFLAEVVGTQGTVVALDIQESALAATREKAVTAGVAGRITLVRASHAEIADHVDPGTGAIMFNLGYLPGGDKSLVTETGTTIAALRAALALLRPGGVLSVVAYPGHPGGAAEREAVAAFFGGLPAGSFAVSRSAGSGAVRPSPEFFGAVKTVA